MKEFSKRSTPQEKTAIDLTETERSRLFTEATKLLRSRGEVIRADPAVLYLNEQGKKYTPEPYLQAEIPSDELAAYRLPYDKVTLSSNEVDLKDGAPILMGIETQRMTTREIPLEENKSPILAMGHETQGVIIAHEKTLGLVVEDEYGEVDLYPGTPDDKQITHDADGNRIVIKGSSLFVDTAPLLSYTELLNLTEAFKKIE